ncbi:hypothetical protein Poly59_28400 [Rubripirellula reticaptiva]|uniref:Uncharacterized protein n=1 Tax=Rubripirellula reticaptiva TaxID=2528013 RepID=A0A5C6EQP6_9BACT|nr:hypothetical protein Poly59_28400 [Rubripirellula reticaptiva]
MVMVVGTALLGAPLANTDAWFTDRIRIAAVPRHRLSAKQVDVNALPATVRPVVVTCYVYHGMLTLLARDGVDRHASIRLVL